MSDISRRSTLLLLLLLITSILTSLLCPLVTANASPSSSSSYLYELPSTSTNTTSTTTHGQKLEQLFSSTSSVEDGCDPALGCQQNAMIKLHLRYLPESLAVILYGVVLGCIVRFLFGNSNDIVKHVSTYNPELFFLFLLPCIIFETGFSLTKSEFFSNFMPILMLATIGTLISFFGTAFGLQLVGKLGISMNLPWKDTFIFSSIACATDPVATLAIFKALDVDLKLYLIVLGESILNDAVSVILFKSVIGYSLNQLWIPALLFIGSSIGSLVLGVAVALTLSLLLKWLNINRYPAIESLFVFIFAYISYLLADALNFSGILSAFFCGIAFQKYGYNSLSNDSKHNTTQMLRMGAFVCETITFIYIGLALPLHSFAFSYSFFLWSILFLIATRALAVFPILGLLNKFRFSAIPMPIQFVVFLSGLRGAVSFSLSMSDEFHSEYQAYIKTQMLLLVYFTIIVFGLSTFPVLKALKIKSAEDDITMDLIGKPIHIETNFKGRAIGSFFSRLDERIHPWFTKNSSQPPRGEREVASGVDNAYQDLNDSDIMIEMDTIIEQADGNSPRGQQQSSSDDDTIELIPHHQHNLGGHDHELHHLEHDNFSSSTLTSSLPSSSLSNKDNMQQMLRQSLNMQTYSPAAPSPTSSSLRSSLIAAPTLSSSFEALHQSIHNIRSSREMPEVNDTTHS
ncbi:hypothetical protein SAMD00019534_125350 [Acytostelium subglobosum LB1]|uniref:hypothetical protein n=1 Tax=Acytostelium subglobosum LB1 TaxID=1410327 RepID=UPI000644B249|nr:hypothetical protein SAMD00019534_125350 [Acytostelium subglobosum LB1]GAM29359.1 hypothetical protein SAMD00019534_125350 [Acytostelium subglobosum LB1]|eukprot:XP_012747690.1 hypothetical protein SAMD00019534_125350 [Acytostelium subglobosum LB1]